MSKPRLGNPNKLPHALGRQFLDENSSTTTDSEKESFDFTALMKRLKETRKTTMPRRNTKENLLATTQHDLNEYPYPINKNNENQNLEMNNSDFDNDDSKENDTDSEIELSWRPLDEIELKRRAINKTDKLFKPMGDLNGEFTSEKISEKCAKLLGYPLPDYIKRPQRVSLVEKGNVIEFKDYQNQQKSLFHNKDFKFEYPVKRGHEEGEDDKEYFQVEEVLRTIKEDIKQTYSKVDNINNFIQSRIDTGHKEAKAEEKEKENNKIREEIPGMFPQKIVYLNHFIDPPEKQPTYFNALMNMKWIVSWPVKWKVAYFVTVHILSFSDEQYTFSGKSYDLLTNTKYLTLSEVDRLFGCYMTIYVISRNIYDITFSIREIYDYAYQYLMEYDELHPILRKYWKELFIYGLMNAILVSIGASAIHLCLAPDGNSSPIYTCLWHIGFGSSQRVGFAVMLIIFYIDLTQEGLNRFKKQADDLKEQEDLAQRRVNKNQNANIFKDKSTVMNFCKSRDVDEDILLESTPPLNPPSILHSPLLKKSTKVEQNESIKLVSVSSVEHFEESYVPLLRERLDEENNKSSKTIPSKNFLLSTMVKIIVFTSTFLQQPVKTIKKLMPYKIYNSVRKAINAPT